MGIYNNLMDQLTDKGALFNVATDTIMTGSGNTIPRKKAIINQSNDKVIGIVGENYKVVSNEEIFNSFCKSIEASDMDTEGATVNVSFAKGGARTLVDFIFPNESIVVPGDTSNTSLSLTTLNSFDCTTRYITKAGGLRMKCLNGQLLGSVVGSYSSTHSPALDVEAGAQQVIKMLQGFRQAEDFWGNMMRTRVTEAVALQTIVEFFNKEDLEDPFRNKGVTQMNQLWKEYRQEMGPNAYALYNAISDYVSHKESKAGANARLGNERRFQKILTTNAVFQAEAA